MARVTLPQTSFTGGEVSPRVHGRTDAPWYATALKTSLNAHPVIHGGWKRRAGLMMVTAGVSTTDDASILVPFVAGRAQAWLLEFSELSVRVIDQSTSLVVATMTTPYPMADLPVVDYCQRDSVMYMFHDDHPISVLQRTGDGEWRFGTLNIDTMPFAEIGHVGTAALTLSAATVGTGRTATSTGAFTEADVGRQIEAGAGRALITAYTDADHVTVSVTEAFTGTAWDIGAWTIVGSPLAEVTASSKDPVGASVTLTADIDCWRAADVGSMVRVNGGLVRVTGRTNGTEATGTIEQVLAATVAAPSNAWTLEQPVWSASLGYPRTGTIHQQRLVVAGNAKFPRMVWGSKIGDFQSFMLGAEDDDAYAHNIDGDEASPIAYVSSAGDLVVLTESAEYAMRGGVEKPITPTNVRAKSDSNHGCEAVRPISVGREVLFVALGGRKLRSMGYRYDFDGYNAPDVSALAEHLTDGGIRWLAYQRELEPMIWAVRGDGALLSCTFDRDQQPAVVGWAEHQTSGFVECVTSLPRGDRTAVYMLVRRTVNGLPVRYIERLDDSFRPIYPGTDGPIYGCTVDAGVSINVGAGSDTFTAPSLAGCEVDIVADGSKMERQTLPFTGAFTLPRTAKRVLVGLPFESRGTLLTPEFVTGQGSAQGQQTHTSQVVLRFLGTIGARVENSQGNSQEVPFRRFGTGVLDEAPVPFTGSLSVKLLGWEKGVAEISIIQEDPMPMHLLSVVRTHTVNG